MLLYLRRKEKVLLCSSLSKEDFIKGSSPKSRRLYLCLVLNLHFANHLSSGCFQLNILLLEQSRNFWSEFCCGKVVLSSHLPFTFNPLLKLGQPKQFILQQFLLPAPNQMIFLTGKKLTLLLQLITREEFIVCLCSYVFMVS